MWGNLLILIILNHCCIVSSYQIYHPPVITLFVGGINHSWVVYGIVLTTWTDFIPLFINSPVQQSTSACGALSTSGWWFLPSWTTLVNGKDYPIYHGQFKIFETNQTSVFFVSSLFSIFEMSGNSEHETFRGTKRRRGGAGSWREITPLGVPRHLWLKTCYPLVI